MIPIRLLAILEATTITGPAKNLLQFAQSARSDLNDPPVEVSIATFSRDGGSDLFLRAAEAARVATYSIPERGRFDRTVTEKLAALAERLRPNIIQTHAVKSHFLLRRAGLDRIYPWVAFHHGYTWPTPRVRLYNQLDRWSLRAARRVVTVSRPFRNELVRNGVSADKIEIVHNAVDAKWAAPDATSSARLHEQLGIQAGCKVVLIVGRLSKEKDHLTLLKAIQQVQKQRKVRPHLVIVGDGPERGRMEHAIHKLELSACVTLVGQVPSAAPYYGIADLVVLSSRSEGSPNALLEAMAARIPVVATNVGGIPEIVAHRESAFLVSAGDAAGMAGAIAAVLLDPELARRMAAGARELIETRYRPASRFGALRAIYQNLLQEMDQPCKI